jgi:GNAT superfamily N-acetyltransferase
MTLPSGFSLATPNLSLQASLLPWDTEILGAPVAQIDRLAILNPSLAAADFAAFELWRDSHSCALASCRLPHTDRLASALLEQRGFRYIETILHAEFRDLELAQFPPGGLDVLPAQPADLPELRHIAENIFDNGRFHVDPMLGPGFGGRRYARWVADTPGHPIQRLLRISEHGSAVAVAIVDAPGPGPMVWRLVGVASNRQSQGYGRRTFLALIRDAHRHGCSSVFAAIAAHNLRVLNLCVSLHGRFTNPEMTFHWTPARV